MDEQSKSRFEQVLRHYADVISERDAALLREKTAREQFETSFRAAVDNVILPAARRTVTVFWWRRTVTRRPFVTVRRWRRTVTRRRPVTILRRRTVTRWAHLADPAGFPRRQMNAAHRRQRHGLSCQAPDDPAASGRHTTAKAGNVRAAGHRQISVRRWRSTLNGRLHRWLIRQRRPIRRERCGHEEESWKTPAPDAVCHFDTLPAPLRLLQCVSEGSKITFLAEFEFCIRAPRRSLEPPITRTERRAQDFGLVAAPFGNPASQQTDGVARQRFILAYWAAALALTSPVEIFAWGESPSQ
jgi:hypothetical protein